MMAGGMTDAVAKIRPGQCRICEVVADLNLREQEMIDMRDYKGPIAGDVVLLNSTESKKNRQAQYALSQRKALFTHVAMCRGLTTFVHASANGVEHVIADELLATYDGSWRAIRHSTIGRIGREDSMRVLKSADYYLGMPYVHGWTKLKKFVRGHELDDETFCSQLIKNVFLDLGVDILPDSKAAYPVHFQDLPEIEPTLWQDVTDEHIIGQEVVKRYPHLRAQALEMRNVARRTRESIMTSDMMHALSEQFLDSMKDVPGMESLRLARPDPPMNYWDRKGKKPPDEQS
ncbi:hypothetical protein QCM80_21950 [Bradyrhizobium sp. SSUT112]|uniref:hypothetical protein n=1 Tax=Bradyrhizobium sp. SSUT112 TaxID=3040604 RepID=UPI0024479C36|nr:hypothetical protein [Bradyrhizobium sp. SSUT112]MDH2353301.1 hypothetical protein [Bradyrhizobium sp. SSUT112]